MRSFSPSSAVPLPLPSLFRTHLLLLLPFTRPRCLTRCQDGYGTSLRREDSGVVDGGGGESGGGRGRTESQRSSCLQEKCKGSS
ncbi:hypothetical protein LINPERHAP1_LOCUS38772 [Linum perenne]